MSRPLTILACFFAASGCVLPDYKLYNDMAVKPSTNDAGSHALAEIISGATGDCSDCLAEQCAAQRASCGASCDQLKLPISPVSEVPTEADPLLQCMVEQCDASCNVRWGCVNRYSWPAPPKAYNITLHVADALSNQGAPNVKVSACQGVDPGCSFGGGMESAGLTNASGDVTLQLQPNFFGYFLIEGGPDYFPIIAYSSQPTYRLNMTFTLNLFPRAWLTIMATQLSTTIHADAGHLIFRAENCLPLRFVNGMNLSAEAADVTVSYGRVGMNSTKVFYTTYAMMIDPTATATTAPGSGYGGALNLPGGATTLVGTHGNVDVMNAGIPMRQDVLAFVFLLPNAR